MGKGRKFKSIAIVMLSSLLLFTSCEQAAAPASIASGDSSTATVVASASGEELFTTILFGEGSLDAAKVFPELWGRKDVIELKQSMTPQDRISLKADIADTVNTIKKQDPHFFNRFKQEIQSGDYLRVSNILQESGAYLRKMIAAKGVDVDQMLNKTLKPAATSSVYSNYYNTATAALNLGVLAVALALFYAIAIVLVIPLRAPTLGTQSQLEKDEFVVTLTDRFAIR